jgi:hypothetical protein
MYLAIDVSERNGATLRLIRSLDFVHIKSLSFALVYGDSGLTVNFTIQVKDGNNRPPRLQLTSDEARRFGNNLLLTSINDLEPLLKQLAESSSSTPAPAQNSLPAIPEMGVPARFRNFMLANDNTELLANKDLLMRFNARSDIKAYPIVDQDSIGNVFNVSFVANGTSPEVIRDFDVHANGTHILFEKRVMITAKLL